MNPYRIGEPSVISFSGGRTSGYMLYQILQEYGGKLPDGIKVIFCNTGKEREETLEFVERCSLEWGVEIVWLEYRYRGQEIATRKNGKQYERKNHSFEIVNYATASRNGEPLEQIIEAKNMLPNPVARFCTIEGKIKTCQRYLLSIGWTEYTNAIGMRYDEPERVAKLRANYREDFETSIAPLYSARVNESQILDWWSKNSFDLQLQPHEGNCDLCFLKGGGKIRRILADRPDLAQWWIDQESRIIGVENPGPAVFRKDRPRYSIQLELSQRPGLFDTLEDPDELSISCSCTD